MKYIENLLQEMTVAQKTPLQKILGLKRGDGCRNGKCWIGQLFQKNIRT